MVRGILSVLVHFGGGEGCGSPVVRFLTLRLSVNGFSRFVSSLTVSIPVDVFLFLFLD